MRFILLFSVFIVSLQWTSFIYGRSQFTFPDETPQNTDKLKQLSLILNTSKSTYHLGENMSISVTSNRDCYLTLLDFSTSGNTHVLFPNEYQQNNLIRANKKLTIPNNLFEIKIGGATGKEQLWARCSLDNAPLFNINYDFQKSTFTSLGKMNNFKAKHRIPPVFNPEQEAWVKTQIRIKK